MTLLKIEDFDHNYCKSFDAKDSETPTCIATPKFVNLTQEN